MRLGLVGLEVVARGWYGFQLAHVVFFLWFLFCFDWSPVGWFTAGAGACSGGRAGAGACLGWAGSVVSSNETGFFVMVAGGAFTTDMS
jgi:hypothetical protein